MTVTKSITISGITEAENKRIDDYVKSKPRLTKSDFMIRASIKQIEEDEKKENNNG